MITIKDVAKHAGVAVSTVSNVLNRPEIVSDEKKEQVYEAIRALKYVPNVHGQSLKKTKQKKIGIYLESLAGEFYSIFLQSASHTGIDLGYNVLIQLLPSDERNVANLVMNGFVDGAILSSDRFSGHDVEKLHAKKFPVVFIDREECADKIGSVVIDNKGGAYDATKHLVQLGHKKILYIHGQNNYDNRTRYSGYLQCLNEFNLQPFMDNAFQCNYHKFQAYNSIREYFNRLTGGVPDAIFAANDEMADGCISALESLGMKVPTDISVVGFDNIPAAQYTAPPLTTIANPYSIMGIASVKKLVSMLEGSTKGDVSFLKTELIVRKSAGIKQTLVNR